MWNGINGVSAISDEPRCCPKCGRIMTVHYSEREYETGNPHYLEGEPIGVDNDPLAICAVIEAWTNCPYFSCDRDVPESGWSSEVFGRDAITNGHIRDAIGEAIDNWRDTIQFDS